MNYSEEAKGMIQTILIVGAIGILLSFIYYRSLEFLPFLWGVILGTLVSVVKVIMLDKSVDKALTMSSKRASSYVALQQLLRLAISAIALYLGATMDGISLWGVVLGILSFQAAIYRVGPGKRRSE
ncbi:ATP synthase subunit I [Aerococcaceae bacterium WGS1372]